MAQLAQDPNRAGQSILEVIMGGNYSSFENQRNYLELLAKEGYRPTTGQSNRSSDRNRDHGHRPPRNQSAPQRPPQGRSGSSRRKR
jgi:non-canonical poly(A) RNA polymerase PAPD5/7